MNGDEAGDSSTVVTETIASAQADDTEQAVPDEKQSGDAAASEKAAVSLQVQDMSVSRAASSDIERAYRGCRRQYQQRRDTVSGEHRRRMGL